MATREATADEIAGADLVVAGSPVLAFRFHTEQIRESIGADPGPAPGPPDLLHPSMRSWLEAIRRGEGRAAVFDTEGRGPFGNAAPAILRGLEEAGYRSIPSPKASSWPGSTDRCVKARRSGPAAGARSSPR
jgi:hypothetical protein